MKLIYAILALGLLGGCEDGTIQDAASSGTGIADLLQSGSPQACSAQEVRDTVISTVKPTFRPDGTTTTSDIELGLSSFSYSLDVITLASVDNTVHSVTCDANLKIADRQNGSQEYSILYVIRPSAEDPENFVVSVSAGDAKTDLRVAASQRIATARDERLTEETAAAPAPVIEEDAELEGTPSEETLDDVNEAIDAVASDGNEM